MRQKTSQLQVRVSPEQKAKLKKLARAAGLSVSEYVLAAALPAESETLRQLVDAFPDVSHRQRALLELRADLSRIPVDEFDASGAGVDLGGLPPLQQSLAAAAFEHEAQMRRCAPPPWTRMVRVPETPTFRPGLASLHPYLMCVSPAALKRRNVFTLWDDQAPPRLGDRDTEDRPTHRPPNEHEERLARLDAALQERGVAAELCLVGGAIMPFVFQAIPESRHPRSLLASDEHLAAATAEACPELDTTWVNRAALYVTRIGQAGFYERPHLSVLEPPAEYVLAMKCLTLAWGSGHAPTAERDLSYLMRFLGLSHPEAALQCIGTYLNDRQIPGDLATRLPRLI